jgi:hypothetical protein
MQHDRVAEDPVQDEANRKRPALPALCMPMVHDTVGIKAHAFHLSPCMAARESPRTIKLYDRIND